MLVVNYGRVDETLKRLISALDEISIGDEHGGNTLVLVGALVAQHHARLVWQAPHWVLHPIAETRVNGHVITAPTFVTRTDEIRIGMYVLWIQPELAEPIEQDLIDNARTDDAAREVYADWLEVHGQWDRAEFLRLQIALKTIPSGDPKNIAKRLHNVARCVDRVWRMAVSRPPIEGCSISPELICNRDWSELTPTKLPTVRACGTCARDVYYVDDPVQAGHHARRGDCIAFDLGAYRSGTYHDLARPPMPTSSGFTIGQYAPPSYNLRRCNACGNEDPVEMRFCTVCGARR